MPARRRGLLAGGFLLLALAIGYLTLPGFVNNKSLGFAVAKDTGGNVGAGPPSCKPLRDDDWECSIRDPGHSGTGYYEVEVDGRCWDGPRTGPKVGDGITWPDRSSGCVELRDNLRPLHRLYLLVGLE